MVWREVFIEYISYMLAAVWDFYTSEFLYPILTIFFKIGAHYVRAAVIFTSKTPGKLVCDFIFSSDLTLQYQSYFCSLHLGIMNIYFLKCLPVGSHPESKG